MARCFSNTQLREHRTAAGLRPEELALRINRTAASVYSLERGYSLPSVPVLAALADALGCSIDDLFEQVELHAAA